MDELCGNRRGIRRGAERAQCTGAIRTHYGGERAAARMSSSAFPAIEPLDHAVAHEQQPSAAGADAGERLRAQFFVGLGGCGRERYNSGSRRFFLRAKARSILRG